MRSGSGARLRATLVAAVLIGGCQAGGADVDIDEAAGELEAAAVAVLSTLAPDGEVASEVEVRPCVDAANRETGEFIAELGLTTFVTSDGLRGQPPDELMERSRAALRAHGFEIDRDFPGGAVKGERADEIGLVLTPRPDAGTVSARGSTGCRPPA